MTLKESHVGHLSRFVYRPSIMFLLGALITTISMSVSISLSLLVPLSARGFVRRENVVPYIMGANVTTFIDTVLAALLLNNPGAFTIIFANMTAITLVSLLVLATVYRRYEDGALAFSGWVIADRRHLAIFMVSIVVIPLLLILL
jgi:Na+/phosphate symporter